MPIGADLIDVDTPAVRLRVLSWGPADAPIALCLHGFPDTACGWRRLAPLLVAAGWRVVAPFSRGYAPSSPASDDSYHIGALMDDALRVLDAVGPTGRDVLIGHDWGAIAGAGLAALPDSPFARAVIMSVPPAASITPLLALPGKGRLLATLPAQLLRSWYIFYFQLPWLPERSRRLVPLLWRRWSPGYDAEEDLRYVEAAIGAPERWRAALSYYRTTVRSPNRAPARYADRHRYWLSAPRVPTLYLHGTDDGCASARYADWVRRILPDGSAVRIVEHAGHFLQLDQPEVVARHIVDFIGAARP
ncbi:alpha/beta hydrolase fold family protein [Mycolicibacterium hassiacum DSM 44199]|uniref:Alpha/beta hydrolase fold family protein n=1 Tax=Mycolicibacterium hassiacum (strain DSM 44199 / CIP 105218 / JCM 12690 / 3849) TaxID=1122247 RepID=K5BIN8_MYCHD|nr:alpha/beta fold hydrolase [Mycolicibacterium hassiacum]EKF21689.1 alpha/beta hydrolase fold family protein [Mycolicibacterium hassiacum DSM 44199]MDA4084221.1 epoxide hydrolase [Mycolicibacterium hassiacum DSM 44199]VCT91230.1 Epoxide hydrolase A [Mycolicibacterium hassiacum DSM 44199]